MNEAEFAAKDEASWWRRTSGGREVLQVALPLVVSALSWTVMTFVDRIFLKWESGAAMAASYSASTVWFAILCLPLGICIYVSTFVSQFWGSRQPTRIGPVTWQGVWTALLFSPLVFIAIPLAPALFHFAGHGPETTALEITYFQILCWGIPALLVAQAFSSFYSGRSRTSVVMYIDAFFSTVNLVLDYLWIFGHAGFPAMGIEGAGWATVVSLWLKALTYLLLILRRQHREQFATWSGMRFDSRLCGRLLYFGGPNGLQLLLDVSGFTVFILLVGRLGAVESEATSMAFSISTLAFMPVWGMGLAVGILVGQRLGENRDDLAARATWTGLWISLAYMVLISVLYVFTPGLFLFAFFANGESAQQAELRSLSVMLLRFVAAYNCLDAVQMVFVSAIKGAGDTVFLLYVSVVMAALLGGLSWLAVEVLSLGVYGCWALIAVWIWMLALIFFARFRQGKWRRMRVIEQQ